jgi:prevent-host-death family protein
MTTDDDFNVEFEVDKEKILAHRDALLTPEMVQNYRKMFPYHIDTELDFVSLKELKANPSAVLNRAVFTKAPVSVLVNNKVKAVVLDYQMWRHMSLLIGHDKEEELRAKAWDADQKRLYLSKPRPKP